MKRCYGTLTATAYNTSWFPFPRRDGGAHLSGSRVPRDFSLWLQPVRLRFWMMNTNDAETFLEEFVAMIPSRVHALERNVRATPGFEGWRADFSRTSIAALTQWYKVVGEREPLDPSSIRPSNTGHPSLPDSMNQFLTDYDRGEQARLAFRDLTIESSAIAVDIGIYMAESLHKVYPTLRWVRCDLFTTRESNFPVLEERSNRGFDPIMSGCKLAFAILRFPENNYCFADRYDVFLNNAGLTEQYRQSRLEKKRSRPGRTKR
jgi:hypothetical protein